MRGPVPRAGEPLRRRLPPRRWHLLGR
jgi:hypothetical protein